MKNHQGATPLLTAALNGHTDICDLLLEHGSDVAMRNHQGFTPLLAAAQNGHTDICGLLLAHGSDVNEVHLKTKLTALHEAAVRGHEAVVEALLPRHGGADLIQPGGCARRLPEQGAGQPGMVDSRHRVGLPIEQREGRARGGGGSR